MIIDDVDVEWQDEDINYTASPKEDTSEEMLANITNKLNNGMSKISDE